MDTEKTNTQTEAESLNDTSYSRTDEEKDFINGIIYSLYEEAIDELDKQTEAERADYNAVLDRFAELEGAQKKSPYVMMYAGFYLGVGKGIDLVRRMESKA